MVLMRNIVKYRAAIVLSFCLLALLLTIYFIATTVSAFAVYSYNHESKHTVVEATAVGAVTRNINHYHSHTGGPVPIGQRFWVSVTMSSEESTDTVIPVVFSTLVYSGCVMEEIIYDNTTTASRSARMRFYANMENENGNSTTDAHACRWAFRSTASNGGTQFASLATNGYVPRTFVPLLLTDEIAGVETYERNLNRTLNVTDPNATNELIDYAVALAPVFLFIGILYFAVTQSDGLLHLIAILAGSIAVMNLPDGFEPVQILLVCLIIFAVVNCIYIFRMRSDD